MNKKQKGGNSTGLFDKIFGSKNNNVYNISSNMSTHVEEDYSNKIKGSKCDTSVDKDTEYCWKCGNQIQAENKEQEEKVEYQYPEIELIKDESFKKAIKEIPSTGILNVPIGLDKDGKWIYYDITKMPNLLIGGTVMSGKTNLINSLLLSLISKYSVEEVRIILADSKGVDYSCFYGEPHMLFPVIKNVRKLETILKYEIKEMQNRYALLSAVELKKISDYNKLEDVSKIPYHLIFVDDYTAFANGSENECNSCIEMLAKSGWSVGIHLIIVANHPTVDVLTAISQLNFPTRISFRVPSIKDSRMVLESPGAEKIFGVGNALINSPLNSKLEQIHINVVEDNDMMAIIDDIMSKNKTSYIDVVTESESMNVSEEYDDPLYNDIVEFVIMTGRASASLLQRRFKLGYNRAARVIDLLEERGIIGPQIGSKPRKVLAEIVQKDNL